jgi:hypothetical protein
VVADVTHPLIGVDFLSHFGLLVDCKHNRLIGQHSRFLPVSHGARTTSTVSLRPISAVRDPHQPGERHLPITRDPQSTGLPNSQDRQSALPFPGHAELLQAISAPRGVAQGTTSRRSLRLQNQRNWPNHLNASRPSNSARRACHAPLYWHASTHPRLLHSSQTPPRSPWVLCCSNASRMPGSLLPQETQPKAETNSDTTTTNFNQTVNATRPRHHRLSHELHAQDVTHASLLSSTAEQPSPRGVDVGTAHINSGAGQSQLRRHPMLSNGRINTFPQQRSRPRFSVNNARSHGNSSANNENKQLGKVSTTRSE